ncbi:hypothetical protein J421_4842 (plasmid) [Gemmatirosa kalamazoonensis]|uniref:Uncharacterized protein n=2 Tax=Gemmatirosa kalamazoonensis TaxID=861299 RepID=W0RPG1_9BACT|nr:hypothetical protein J421_4842 [Gemmatirosa kalamazoonensis]
MPTLPHALLLLSAAAFMTSSAAAQAGGIPAGTYRTTVTKAELKGRVPPAEVDSVAGPWVVTFDAAGHMTVQWKGRQVVVGTAQPKPGHRVYFDAKDTGPYACHMPATYRYSVRGTRLVLSKVSDKCAGRAAVLTAHPLARGS